MSFRRLLPILIFLAGAFLGKPLALGSVGLFAKAFFYFENGWHLSYGSIDWHEGKLILKEIDLKETAGSLHAKSLSIFVTARHVEIEKPRINLRALPSMHGGGGDWTLEVKEGVLAVEGLGEFCFSFERTWRTSLGRLVLEKENSSLAIEAMREENEIWVDAHLHNVEADFLKPWIDLKGVADGRVHLVFLGTECKRGSTHLDFKEAGFGLSLSDGEGSLDWEGEVSQNFFAKCFETARVRLAVSKGNILAPKGKVEEIKGLFSFTAGVGAKWDFNALGCALGEEFPIGCSGRAFLHDSRPFWAESQAKCQSAQFAVTGKEEEDGFRWSGEVRKMGAIEGTLLQSLASLAFPFIDPFEFEQGAIDFDGEALFGKKETENYLSSLFQATEVANPFSYGACILKVNNFAGRYEENIIAAKSGWLEWTSEKNGAFDFQGASGHSGKLFSIEEWEGRGVVEKGSLVQSHFEGTLEGKSVSLQATGTLGAFHIDAKAKNGEISFKGLWEERFDLDTNNLKNRVLTASALPQNPCLHSRLGQRQWSLAPDKNFEEPLCQIPDSSGCLCIDIESGCFEGLSFGGQGWVEPAGAFWLHLDRFEGDLSPFFQALGCSQEGYIRSVGDGFLAEGDFSSFNCFLQAKGDLGPNMGFYCPLFRKEGESYFFDVRIDTPKLEIMRLFGTANAGICTFDSDRTHFLGSPIQSATCISDFEGISTATLEVPLFWKSLVAIAPIFLPKADQLMAFALDGMGLLNLTYSRSVGCTVELEGQNLLWKNDPVSFQMSATDANGVWGISTCQVNDCQISVQAEKKGESVYLQNGRAIWKGGMEAYFAGFIDSSLGFELKLPHLKIRLSDIEPIASSFGIFLNGLDGILEGQGNCSRFQKTEANFDLTASSLKTAQFNLQNQGEIHFHYDSDVGIFCRGLNLSATGPNLPFFGCQIELLQFDTLRSVWSLKQSAFQLPPNFLDFFPNLPPFLTNLDPGVEIQFSANLECPSDFSSLFGFVKEVREVRNLSFSLSQTETAFACELDYQNCPVKVLTQVHLGDTPSGRLILEGRLEPGDRPLSIEWTYLKDLGFLVHEIDGQFGGVDASFHALDEGRTLIGSARVNFKELSQIIPPRISQVFSDLKMGSGYELKGKLFLGSGISFKGLFSGKQMELFGYQIRTLLSQCEFDANRIRLSDLKISDSAGIFKIDELIAETVSSNPWTLSIPHLTILELRPSLLQKSGSEPKEAGPLVVRELKIENLQGLLEDSKTYAAKGDLSFINSFRREHTVFDIPSDLLGRIVGLDLELLIPACGSIQYELKNGFFHLTSLSDSYSEAHRSEFFLSPDLAPKMDLDGNLHILVSMKQYVLFKLTESFQILVDGNLGDPQFHLQKKRRFLGL